MNQNNAELLDTQANTHFSRLTDTYQSDLFIRYQETIKRAFALSDFVAQIAIRYPQKFEDLLPSLIQNINNMAPIYPYQRYTAELAKNLENAELEPQLHAQIRQFRHLKMLEIACLDMLSKADFKESLKAVSTLADTCITQALLWLHKKACQRYGEPEENQTLLILGMGKLGGEELNFSSDIDLIFVYPCAGETQHPRKPIEHQVFFTRLAQKLISALHQTTVDGQAYRVDMRLRPLGDSGPLVTSLPAFELYYQEQGREWERFAMQKARIINEPSFSEQSHIDELKSIIRPYVYRKYLDFTTLESLRDMKRMIAAEVKRKGLSNNIKLGAGGIREVEFFVQCHQLIHAGRISECQTPSLFKAMIALQSHSFVKQTTAKALLDGYTELRKIEHYLQAFDDKQTQILPEKAINQARLCYLTHSETYEHFTSNIEQTMALVHEHFVTLIASPEEQADQTEVDDIFTDLWRLDLSFEEANDLLNLAYPIEIIKDIYNQVDELKQKASKASIRDKGKAALNKLIPMVIEECALDDFKTLEPMFTLIAAIIGRTTYLELLSEHKSVRERLLSLFAKSSWIAQQISTYPLLLDELLHPAYLKDDKGDINTWKSDYSAALQQQMLRVDPLDEEAQMDALRYFKVTQQLRIAAADLTGHLSINRVSDKLTLLAEAILSHCVELAWQQLFQKYGNPSDSNIEDKKFAILAYGKMGGWEMSYGSDIDMVCIHEAAKDGHTDGKKQVSNTEFYVKLVQRIMHLFTTKTYLGELYELDLRLRPSGNSGLLISHIDTFKAYQHEKAWTWEHQALTRSRCVYGSESLKDKFKALRKEVISLPREKAKLQDEVYKMRLKMRAHLDKSETSFVDLKQSKGGITDLEFLVQYLVLLHAHDKPHLVEWSDNLRILDSLADEGVIDLQVSRSLQKAYLDIRNKAHQLTLQQKGLSREDDPVTQHFALIAESFNAYLKA